MTDIRINNCGSVVLLKGVTDAGERWLDDNTDHEAMRWGGAVVAEPRYVDAILDAAHEDGLVIR